MTSDDILRMFGEVVQQRHDYARKWKDRTGGKVVGSLSLYAPEELIYAAGALPVRILGSHEPQDEAGQHIWGGRYCCLVRDCLAQGLRGKYSYLDGIVETHGCQHMHQVFESWRRHIPTAFSHFVFAPTNLDSRHAKDCLIGELDDFESSFVEWIGNGIPDERIRKAGEVYNANRRLLHSIYDLRKSDNVPISGEEALQVTLSSMLMDKEEHNSLLEQLLRELPGRERKARSRTRLMIVGCDFDDPELFRLIEESLDADIVIDDSGTGSRYFWSELSGDSASTVAIADRLLNIPPSPIHDHGETRHRPPHILKMARDYRVDCVAIVVRTFCDSHQFDIPAIRGALETNGIPVIVGKWGGPVHCVKSKCKEGLVKMLRNDMEKVKRESIRG